VDIHLGRRVTAADVLAIEPDNIIVATGGTPRLPDGIEGLDQPHVVQAWDVLEGKVSTGQRVLVIDDEQHIQGCNVAELLASQGKDVELITREFQVGAHMEPNTRMATLRRVDSCGVTLSPTTWVRTIAPGSVTLYHFYSQQEREEPFDTVVLACGVNPETRLYRELSEHHLAVRAIGDCDGPRRLEMATFEGHLAARELDGDVPTDRPLVSMPIRRA